MKLHYVLRRIFALVCLSMVLAVSSARANEIWVAPTLQTDTGGLGVGNGIWPVSPIGVTRLVVAVPSDLQTFQGAKIVMIPKAPAGAGVLHLFVCTAENSDMVGASCSGPLDQAFTGVVNQLVEVDVSAALAPSVTGPGVQYLAVAAYTTPTLTTDHIVGLRFAYTPTAPTGVATLGANTFTGTQTAPAFAGDGSGLTNVSANLLDGIDSTAFALAAHGHDVSQVTNAARLSGGNTFTALQTIDSGNLDLDPSTAASGNVTKNGSLFLHNLGVDNTFLGLSAGNGTLTGTRNTAVGANVMTNATTASFNTAGGTSALRNVTVGANNTAYGLEALFSTTTGSSNTAIGAGALHSSTTANSNTAVGSLALWANTTGIQNTAVGIVALNNNTSGADNTAVGRGSLLANTVGMQNAALGGDALGSTTGSLNLGLGYSAGTNNTTGSNNIYLGAAVAGVAGESNTMYLGKVGTQTKTLIAGVRGITTGVNDAIPVMIDSAGQLGTVSSSRRFKEDIQDMPTSLADRLFKLRPVTFRYTRPYTDGSKPIQYGLVAEEVAEVFPELAVRNADGDVETVHYETLNVLLLKQFQEQQRELDQLKQQVRELIETRNKP